MGIKNVVVVGAGPGGLTAAMILASHGYKVHVFEKRPHIGGRNSAVEIDDFVFDLGPTFLMMRFILEEMFELTGRNVDDYLEIRNIDPLYRLVFGDGRAFFPTRDAHAMKEQIGQLFPGNYKGYLKYLKYEKKKFERLMPCLQVPYSTPSDLIAARLVRALPYLDAHRNLVQHLGKYFDDESLMLSFTFQAKYLGMSPWKCPGLFSIISYIEHSGGVHHPIGGLNQIPLAMARVVQEEGGAIHLNCGVRQVIVRNGRAVGVTLEDGSDVMADHVVLNADFGHAVNHLLPRDSLKKWTPETLAKKGFSCSGFLLYLAVNKTYPEVPHHNILFAEDYRKNVTEISDTLLLSEDPSIYVQNACVTDPSLAPAGQSTIYILVPIANNRSGIDWEAETPRYRDKVIALAEQRGGLTDLRKHIVNEAIITPTMWEKERFVYDGAIFNLAHSMDQLLIFRPNNAFEEIQNLFLVGGGTHPGSGLPTILESARISAGLIMKKDAWYLRS